MGWEHGSKYGRWEGRVLAPVSDPSYNALLLLWPDAEDLPVGGEIDFMEMLDHTRRTTDLFLHYGANNDQVHGSVATNGAEWHNWAVEWTPTHVAAFVDGQEWWRTTRFYPIDKSGRLPIGDNTAGTPATEGGPSSGEQGQARGGGQQQGPGPGRSCSPAAPDRRQGPSFSPAATRTPIRERRRVRACSPDPRPTPPSRAGPSCSPAQHR